MRAEVPTKKIKNKIVLVQYLLISFNFSVTTLNDTTRPHGDARGCERRGGGLGARPRVGQIPLPANHPLSFSPQSANFSLRVSLFFICFFPLQLHDSYSGEGRCGALTAPEPSNPEEQPQETRTRPPLPRVEGTPAELIRRFFTLQENRVGIYRRFNDGFQKHLAGGLDGGRYDQLCREITSEMSARSLEVIAVEEALKAAGQEAPAASIRVVQMGEKVKLNMTCTLQVLKKSAAENRWSWQQPHNDSATEDAAAAAAAAAASAHANAGATSPGGGGGGVKDADGDGDGLNPSWANGNFKPKCETHPVGRKKKMGEKSLNWRIPNEYSKCTPARHTPNVRRPDEQCIYDTHSCTHTHKRTHAQVLCVHTTPAFLCPEKDLFLFLKVNVRPPSCFPLMRGR